jgi:hypothetical protein
MDVPVVLEDECLSTCFAFERLFLLMHIGNMVLEKGLAGKTSATTFVLTFKLSLRTMHPSNVCLQTSAGQIRIHLATLYLTIPELGLLGMLGNFVVVEGGLLHHPAADVAADHIRLSPMLDLDVLVHLSLGGKLAKTIWAFEGLPLLMHIFDMCLEIIPG